MLLDAREWAGAFYVAGYAIECALKVCIAGQTKAQEFPDRKRAEAAWSHKPSHLVRVAGLNKALDDKKNSDSQFMTYWDWATGDTGWTENSRYRWDTPEKEARDLFNAITDPGHGILEWIKKNW